MNYKIINYEVINGSKLESRQKEKSVPSIDYIDTLQKRAERIWRHIHNEELTVLINYMCPANEHIPWKNDDEYYEKVKGKSRIVQPK
jgi:hypothetical protein